MAGLTPLPPHVLHSSTRLTHAQAHAQLSAFLEKAENDAAYRPDSQLSERGPQSTSKGANPNLTLHHLRRILQGLEGKRVGGEDLGRFFGEGARLRSGVVGHKRKLDEAEYQSEPRRKQIGDENPEDEGRGPGVAVIEEQEGWQDKEDYEQAQHDDELDVRGEERHPGALLDEPGDAEEAEEMAEIGIEGSNQRVGLSEQQATGLTVDKKARKLAKQARRQEEKRQKENAKAKAKK